MKTQSKILIAFILNLAFSIFEFIGGAITGSVAIVSDAIHDVGDAMSIGISYFLEKKSKKQPDDIYTYGYARFSVIGGVITTVILLVGSMVLVFSGCGEEDNNTTTTNNITTTQYCIQQTIVWGSGWLMCEGIRGIFTIRKTHVKQIIHFSFSINQSDNSFIFNQPLFFPTPSPTPRHSSLHPLFPPQTGT
mgnify:CR=1 FL=1